MVNKNNDLNYTKWLGMLYVQKENKIYYLKGDSFECLSWSKVQTLSS